MLRPRLPSAGKTPCRQPGSTPVAHKVPSGNTDGRSFVLWKSPFASPTARMLNGRPELISTIGEYVKPCMNLRIVSPLRQSDGAVKTPLKTNLCLWSNSESERSARKLKLSCGLSSVCRSDESSIECDHVYDARNWKLCANRLFSSRFIAL